MANCINCGVRGPSVPIFWKIVSYQQAVIMEEMKNQAPFPALTYFKVLVVVNFINYLDRGIIPGATNEFNSFISDTIDTDKPDLYLGLLQSSFIVGFSLASIYFGNAVHRYRPFFLVAVGLSIWLVAVIMCGMAWYVNSYEFLAIARMLSGVGEASMQCSMPPWITRYAGPDRAGTWLAIFYTAIPVGTACGYAYSAPIAGSIGWRFAFFFEALAMIPFVGFFYACRNHYQKESDMLINDNHKDDGSTPSISVSVTSPISTSADERSDTTDQSQTRFAKASIDVDGRTRIESNSVSEPPSIWDEVKAVTKSPIWICVTLGYAAQTGALIGLSTFGSSFVMALGFFNTETEASTFFGVVISLAGILGTPMGGILLDKLNKMQLAPGEEEVPPETQLGSALAVIAGCSCCGCILMCMLYEVYDKWLWMIVVMFGCAVTFATSSGVNIAAMKSVDPMHRSFAIAFLTVVMHAFGDVPSPIIAGLLKDTWAPGCVGDDDNIAASEDCRDDSHGIRQTMLVITLWLIWTVIFFNTALYIFLKSRDGVNSTLGWTTNDGSDKREPLLVKNV
jgi:MFS transporter, Spinster family, sphingosine-1-phosphate transporter